MKAWYLSLVLATGLACSSDDGDDDGTTTATVTWEDTAAQAIVTNSCASSSCHGGTRAPNFLTMTQEQFVAYTDSGGRSPLDRMNATGSLVMPPTGALDEESINTVATLFE